MSGARNLPVTLSRYFVTSPSRVVVDFSEAANLVLISLNSWSLVANAFEAIGSDMTDGEGR